MNTLAAQESNRHGFEVRHDWPPNIAKLRARFVAISESTIFTYAPVVYVPGGFRLPVTIAAHERVHLRQQGDDPATWWERYVNDVEFRFQQELEAHRAEWRAARRGGRRDERYAIASRLASPLYGSMITVPEALKAIGK